MLRIDPNEWQIAATDACARAIIFRRELPAFAAIFRAIKLAGLLRRHGGDQRLRRAGGEGDIRLHDVVRQAIR